MMSLETTVKEICGNLCSNKATERKRSVETLKDYLTRNAVPDLLSDNTRKKAGFSWNDLFDIITDYLLKEAEKYESSKTFHTVTYPLCVSILHLCVAGSNKGRAYIKCDKIMDAALFVLRNKYLTNAIGDAYLSLLQKYVLPCDNYVSLITPSTWEDLLDIIVAGCLDKVSKLDDFTKLKLLWLVIKNAKECCQFACSLRNNLSDITKYFHKINKNKKMLEVVSDIITLILDVLYLENRLSVCEFIEKNLPLIFEFYEQNMDVKKKSQVFNLLHTSIAIHHPLGRIKNEESAQAHNWEEWNICLQSIMDLITLEISYIQKSHRHSNTLLTCANFNQVSAIMFFLTFKMSTHNIDVNCDGERAAKRPRTTVSINQTFKDLIGEFKQNHIPWIGITEVYVKHFGCSLSIIDYEILLKTLEEFVSTNKINEIWCIFESLTCQVLKNLKALKDGAFIEHVNSLWMTCVRNSTSGISSHIAAIHGVLQTILSLNILDYMSIKPLLLMYYEKGMPISDSSVQTLNILFRKFYSKCCYNYGRTKCFKWFINGRVTQLYVVTLRDLFLTLLLNDNISNNVKSIGCVENETLHHILFNTVDKSILYADFELEISKPELKNECIRQALEINDEMNYQVIEYLQEKLMECNEKIESKDFDLLECLKILKVTLTYLDIALKYNYNKVLNEQIYDNFKSILKTAYTVSSKTLKSGIQISEKNALLKTLQPILLEEYDTVLNNDVRTCIDNDFFHCINEILNSDVPSDDDDSDTDMSYNVLKHNCIFFLAAYCKKNLNYRDELLELILNPKLYNFSSSLDVDFALKCIRFLNQSDIEDAPIELTFVLMQSMCKDLFRNSNATAAILKTLLQIMNRVWQHGDNMRRNCLIMVKSYLHRCENMYYPPEVAALVYECTTKIIILNYKDTNPIELTFKDVLIDKIKGNIHSIRLYCGYLINEMTEAFTDEDELSCLLNLKDLFTVVLSNEKETILKDELNNRTATVLHTYYVLALNKPSRIHRIVQEIVFLQREKSLDKQTVKKVLNIILNKVMQNTIDNYLDQNILCLLQCWLEKKLPLDNFPLYLFNYDSDDLFYKKYMNWLVSADILWRHQGNLQKSDMMRKFKQIQSEETILEESFCSIIILSLPYIVNEKYSLSVNKFSCKESTSAACRMFQQMRQMLQSETWSKLFVENMDQLVLLTALHLKDYADAKQTFDFEVPKSVESFTYPKEIFCGILKYFGELIDDNILECFCKDQPLAMLKILFTLWELVLSEKIFAFKVMSLHTFIVYIENIPLGFPSDVIIFNFSCINMSKAIKETKSQKELDAFSKALFRILKRVCANKNKVLQKETVAQLLSILSLKKHETPECNGVYKYVIMNFKNFDDDMQALYIVLTEIGTETCLTETNFLEKLQKYERNLSYASTATLSSMRKFLSAHKKFLSAALNKFDNKGFSEDCEDSVIHNIIVALCKILRTTLDEKMIVEASNCLAEVGTYDLKTLVTVPPKDTTQLVNMKPTQYFAITVVKALLEIIFNENPTVSEKVSKALLHLMKFKDGQLINIEWGVPQSQILKCLMPSTCESFAQFKVRSVSTDWTPATDEDHFQWITRVTVDLLQTLESPLNYLSSLRTLCRLKPTICPKILPSLVGLLLEHSSENLKQIIGQQINTVFNYIWCRSFNDSTTASEDSTVSKLSNILDHDQKMIVHYLLDVVNAIRLQTNHLKIRKCRDADTLRYLKLEYDKLSWAATVADKNIAAIYYAELWAAAHNDDVPPASPDLTACLPGGEHVQRILRNCFVSIGELDAIDGCGTAHLTSEDERRKHLLHTGQYADALLLHDIVLSHGNQSDNRLQHGVVMSLHKSGMHHLALQYIKSFPENEELNDVKFDCLAYLGDWSEIVDTKELEEKTNQPLWNPDVVIKSLKYACLKESLNADPNQNFEARLEQALNRAKLATSKLCRILNMENCQSVYKVVANLHLLCDIQDYCSLRCGHTDLTDLLDRWQVDKLPSFKDFRHLETLLSQRSLILEHAAKHYERFSNNIMDLQLQYVEMGLSNQRVQMAQRLLDTVKKMKASEKVSLLESQVAWAKGHKDIALASLHGVVTDQSNDVKLAAMCLRQYGLWMAESKRENARDIITKYLEKSLELLNEDDNAETRFKVYHDIARFADSEYKQIVSYMNSAIFENKVKCIDSMKGTAASLKGSQTSLTKDERKALFTNDRFMQLDEAEVSNTRAEKKSFLNLALRYYMLSLKHCEDNNLSIFRVISLWFDNPDFEFSDSSASSFRDLLNAIPSWKFITVLPQLAPRLTTDRSSFAKYLKEVLARCAIEHPHHTLAILFNLKNSDKDNVILNASKGAQPTRPPGAEPRVLAADALVRELSQRPHLATIISQMELLCDAFISFAYLTPKMSNGKPQRQAIPAAEPLAKLRHLDALPIPTLTIPICHNGDYSTLPNITTFDNHFELVGGINYPKKISCRSSDGKCRILLIKGEDDLRQDAVMQQVFNIVNTLLENNPITKKNKLLIRTYKVVPMSRRSGVLGWCEGTTPLGTYLRDAHIRYRPKDITPEAARAKMKTCQDSRKSNQDKLRVFMEILANFKPVFHNFFTEHYHDPITWYERRLAYTRSVATSSMVGYILGLGDRHVHNILIDETTGEVVHIDFGIAFDQGKALPTPETIPFRLTQDIISGFGCCGIEGIFRRCCEKTLQLLRDNQETLLTILQVLLCDPLYSWTVKGALKKTTARSVVGEKEKERESGAGSGLAERALLSVCGKLSGAEGGAGGGVAVAGQVARLLHAATDPANLSRLFPGWQPYL
ncbi:serine-protein kinase ATM [Papilio machaon]|uniref:serine-protein kinase ATM n=1 Tax=Papilio machaon TaxID=76193 RepID=UPI001E6655F6|nr:serine-protein kinase ATM [Papilio machaon]